VSWTPLVLTLGLHLLPVLAWLLRPAMQAALPLPAERATVLVMVAPPLRTIPLSSPRALAPPVRKTAQPVTAPVSRSPQPPAQPEQPVAEAAPAESELVQSDSAPAATPGDLLADSRAMAGRVDRELRKGGSPITAEPERKWERFAGMVAEARAPAAFVLTLDSHTALDGVTIYRKTLGRKVRCYRSGSVGGISPADGHTGGSIPCPTGVRWTRL